MILLIGAVSIKMPLLAVEEFCNIETSDRARGTVSWSLGRVCLLTKDERFAGWVSQYALKKNVMLGAEGAGCIL
jgi:hypothetical protein